jgi:hypothetical protein
MRRFLMVLLAISLATIACGPWSTQPQVPTDDGDNVEVFVSKGDPILTNIYGRDVSIVLDPNHETDTTDVIVAFANMGMTYLVETADPEGRFLPSVQVVQRPIEEEPKTVQQIVMPQISVQAGWALRALGSINLQMIKKRFMGKMPLDDLSSFIKRNVFGRGVNLILQVPGNMEEFQEIMVYRTSGTMTFLVMSKNAGGGALLSAVQPGQLKFVAVSLLLADLDTIKPAVILEKAQIFQDGIYLANAVATLPPPPTSTPVTIQCAQDEVAVYREENGVTVGECQKAPWLATEAVPSATLEPSPTPTPTTPPTPTPVPVIYTDTFTAVDPQILGNCPASVHDRYSVVAPDGNTYRTWHPITVKIDPSDPDSPVCSFAHEHGDPPNPNAPLPYFGYAAYHAGKLEVIKQHEGYKVFTHKRGQLTGWNTEEQVKINPDIELQFWVHQGSASRLRLTEAYHDAGFWAQDAGGHVTEVYYLADTGHLSDKCGSVGKPGATRAVASECDYGNEIWDFGVNIANVWSTTVKVAVVNPMNFMRGNPNILQSVELVSTSDEICGVNFFPCDYKLPFGHANSIWLGNMRMLHDANWQWTNAGGLEVFCTDMKGNRVADSFCDAKTRGYIRQRVATINYFGGSSPVWDRSLEGIGDALYLPFGAPGGN